MRTVEALAYDRSFITPRHLAWALAFSLTIFLVFTNPTPSDFYAQVWAKTLAGLKADIREKSANNPGVKIVAGLLSALSLRTGIDLNGFVKDSNNAELDKLPAFWMAHTIVHDWKLATYFRYYEKSCSSDYLGMAGTFLNLKDGCDVEPYRTKGGTLAK